jgi:hypothetical protein
MNASQSRNLKLFVALFFLMLLFVELVCFGFYKLNPGAIFDWRYYPSAFDHTKRSNLPFGWTSPEGLPRPDETKQLPPCARVFGDSFTYGEEVYPKDAWPNLASQELGCRIENYGVGGFGTDQAYILYQSTQSNTPIVILGIYSEMLRRNLAASWLFYGMQKDRPLKPYFKLTQQGNLEQITWPANDSTEEYRNYHRHDSFFKSYDMEFPYFWHMSKTIFYHLKTRLENKGVFFDKHAAALPLQLALLDAFKAQANARGSEMVLVFYPSILELTKNDLSYRSQMNAYKAKYPQACVIDVGPALLDAVKKGTVVAAQSLHYSPSGNAIVATEVVKGLNECPSTKMLIRKELNHR